jgi:S1-C subfamily serine protease
MKPTVRLAALSGLTALAGLVAAVRPAAAEVDRAVVDAEAKRIAAINKARPAVCAVCMYGGQGSGSGVVIDPEGYALTNYHVTESTGPLMQCGLADGVLYDAVVVGEDKIGDVALVKLLPKEPGKPFPFVKLGDSDRCRAGDWSLAMGNPFSLAMDFSPTVTYGLISGVNRYQPPAGGGALEYTDCIQIETSINPGNSGGPLFNMDGELIGINGRGSFEKRGRVNSGVGYAISVNQIKNFLGHLYAGIEADHATLGAAVGSQDEEAELSKMVVRQILEQSDVYRRVLQLGDEIIKFGDRPVNSTNQYKNVLGIYPKGWRIPITYRRDNTRRETLVRLMGLADTPIEQRPTQPEPKPKEPARPRPGANSPAAKMLEPKKGFTNYYFNKLLLDKLLTAFKAAGDFSQVGGGWGLVGSVRLADKDTDFTITITDGSDGLTEVKISRSGIEDAVKPLDNKVLGELQLPQGSGGLLVALYQYRRLLTLGKGGFEQAFDHAGWEPCYPPKPDGSQPASLAELRVDCEVLRTKHGAFDTKWYFDKKDKKLIGCEATIAKDEDPCEVYFGDYKPVDGRSLPHRIDVRFGDKRYGVLTIKTYKLAEK